MTYAGIAQSYIESGWPSVLPLPPRKKFPPPSGFTGYGSPNPSMEQVSEWIDNGRGNGNVALRMPPNVLAIDIDHGYRHGDGLKAGLDSFQSLVDRLGPLPQTWASTSRLNGEGAGSGIRLYRVPEGIRWHERAAGGDIELISHNHRYIVAWPSIHPDTGQTYRWLLPDGNVADSGVFPSPDDLPELPDAWVTTLSSPKKVKSAWELPSASPRDVEKLLAELEALAEGDTSDGRNNDLNRLAWRLGQLVPGGLIDEKTVRDKLWSAAIDCGLVAEDGESKTWATINSGLKVGINDPRRVSTTQSRPLTDMGNGQRFADRNGGDALYVHTTGQWFVWDGVVWRNDSGGIVQRMAKDTVRGISREVASVSDDEKRNQIIKWYMVSQGDARIRAMLSMASSEYVLSATSEKFDADKHLFNASNCIVNLATGEMSHHNPEKYMTRVSPYKYDPEAQCPQFMAFLKRVFDGNAELISYVQRIVGYSLTGYTDEHKMFVLWGKGANGKSTLLEIILGLTGQYGKVADPNLLLNTMHDRSSVELAVLDGMRMVCCNETDASRSLAESRVKNITGGDTISARHLYSMPFEFRPQFKVWLATNYRPRVKYNSDGLWRRIALIPFEVRIPEHERIKGLNDRLLYEEGSGILTWAVHGAMDWFKQKDLREPECVRTATQEYRESEDTLSAFLHEYFHLDSNAVTASNTVRSLYNEWCRRHNEHVASHALFKSMLRDRGIEHVRTRAYNGYKGIRVRLATDV